MVQIKIGFIGGGNMARSIIGGLQCESEKYSIYVCDPDAEKLSALRDEFSILTCQNNEQLIKQVDAVVLAVKPQVMNEVLQPLQSAFLANQPLIISIAAGIKVEQLLNWLNCKQAACIRVMPNTPALVGCGASGMYAKHCTPEHKQIACDIMNAVGITRWVDEESAIDVVTAVSGSGPAYFFYLMEALQNAAMENGLSESDAKILTLHTALGAAKLAQHTQTDFAKLRQQVTSPGGTTQAAIEVLTAHQFAELIADAVQRAAQRSVELSKD